MTIHEPAARERDGVFLELTRSIRPVCKTTIDAEVNVRDDHGVLDYVLLVVRFPTSPRRSSSRRHIPGRGTYTGELGTDLGALGER